LHDFDIFRYTFLYIPLDVNRRHIRICFQKSGTHHFSSLLVTSHSLFHYNSKIFKFIDFVSNVKVDERMHREMISTVGLYNNDSAVTDVSF
jgi:hypothetical protein